MLVRVKEPRTNVEITGDGDTAAVVGVITGALSQHFEFTVDDEEDEWETSSTSEWFNSVDLTPGKGLRIRRENQGMTLDQLAAKTGIAQSNLSAMENDKRTIGVTTAKKLAEALGCHYRVLV